MDRELLTLARLARMLERACGDSRPPALTLAQYRLLAMIGDGASRASHLAGQLALAKPTVSATVDTPVERGFVERTTAPADRPAVHLPVTTPGQPTLLAASMAIGPLLALLVGLGAINFALSYIRRFVGGRFAFDVQHDLRTTIFERVQRLDFAHHDELPTGQIVSRASSDLALVQALLSFLPLATGNVVLLVLSLVVMLVLSPTLTLIVLAIVPALLFVSLRLRRVMFP